MGMVSMFLAETSVPELLAIMVLVEEAEPRVTKVTWLLPFGLLLMTMLLWLVLLLFLRIGFWPFICWCGAG